MPSLPISAAAPSARISALSSTSLWNESGTEPTFQVSQAAHDPAMRNVVIASARRTPIGKFLGALVLFLLTFLLNSVAEVLRQRLREKNKLV